MNPIYCFDMSLKGREVYVDVMKLGYTPSTGAAYAEDFVVLDRETGKALELDEEDFEKVQDESIEAIRGPGYDEELDLEEIPETEE